MSLIQEALDFKRIHSADQKVAWPSLPSWPKSSKKTPDLKVLQIVKYVINKKHNKMWSVNERNQRLEMAIPYYLKSAAFITKHQGKPLIYEY
jgi:hypothetical protein